MEFKRTKQDLQIIENSEKELALEEVLGILLNNFFTDVTKEHNVIGIEELKINNEEKFITNLIKLARINGRIYEKNKELFSSGSEKKRWEKANTKLSEFEQKIPSIETEMNNLKMMLQILEEKELKYQKMISEQGDLKNQIEKKDSLVSDLENLRSKTQSIQQEIDSLTNDQIPHVMGVIDQYEKQRTIAQNEYNSLQETYEDVSKKYESLRSDSINTQKNIEQKINECKSVEKSILEQQRLLISKNNELSKLEEKKRAYLNKVDDLNKQSGEIQSEINAFKDRKIPNIERIIMEYQGQLTVAQAEFNRLQKTFAQSLENYQNLQKESDNVQANVDQKLEECRMVENRIKEKEQQLVNKERELAELISQQNSLVQEVDQLNVNSEQIQSEIYNLNFSLQQQKEAKEILLSNKFNLAEELNIIAMENNVKKKEVDSLTLSRASAFSEKDNLISLRNTYLEEIKNATVEKENLKLDISKLEKEMKELSDSESQLRIEAEKWKEEFETERKRYTQSKANSSLALKNFHAVGNRYREEQKWISEVINNILDDSQNENWFNDSNDELKESLDVHQEKMSKQLEKEMKMLGELLDEIDKR